VKKILLFIFLIVPTIDVLFQNLTLVKNPIDQYDCAYFNSFNFANDFQQKNTNNMLVSNFSDRKNLAKKTSVLGNQFIQEAMICSVSQLPLLCRKIIDYSSNKISILYLAL
tara:strand:- start:2820 stop:3152 length:333 start_codon:yes stop_codon:yes gene_type:complete